MRETAELKRPPIAIPVDVDEETYTPSRAYVELMVELHLYERVPKLFLDLAVYLIEASVFDAVYGEE